MQSGRYNGFNPIGASALLKDLQKSSKLLERLVLYDQSKFYQHNGQFEEVIVNFVKETRHLVVLGLIGFNMDVGVAEGIKRRLLEEFLPERPSLWVYFGQELPKANDLPVPMRVHLDEIVDPGDWYYTPPRFQFSSIPNCVIITNNMRFNAGLCNIQDFSTVETIIQSISMRTDEALPLFKQTTNPRPPEKVGEYHSAWYGYQYCTYGKLPSSLALLIIGNSLRAMISLPVPNY